MALSDAAANFPRPSSSDPSGEPLLVPATEAARLVQISRSHWWRLNATGYVPAPLHVGTRCPRWVLRELQDWIAAGCPPRDVWERGKGVVG